MSGGTRRFVVGISGASGMPYARRLLAWFAGPGRARGVEAHVVASRAGRLVWAHEIGEDLAAFGLPVHAPGDLGAPFASGSARFDGMAVAPCSAAALARIAHGTSHDLLGRAADVMLKERRPLVLLLREAPYSLVHVRNMALAIEAGAVVLPASPGFYARPSTLAELVDGVVGRVLDQLGLDNDLAPRWSGMGEPR